MSVEKSLRGWGSQPKILEPFQQKLRELARESLKYPPILPQPFDGEPIRLCGHSPAELVHAVYKTSNLQSSYLHDQALYMEHLGDQVCPRILSLNNLGYAMEYLLPASYNQHTIQDMEYFLTNRVWYRRSIKKEDNGWIDELIDSINLNVPPWAYVDFHGALLHGDCTADNLLWHQNGTLRITDPIPPQYLNRPSIVPIDQARMLQSFLGWETVLRGVKRIDYDFPQFLRRWDTARIAIFWCMVTLKRIAAKDTTSPGQWAKHIAGELECML